MISEPEYGAFATRLVEDPSPRITWHKSRAIRSVTLSRWIADPLSLTMTVSFWLSLLTYLTGRTGNTIAVVLPLPP